MGAYKFWNPNTNQWEYLQQGPKGDKGEKGDKGDPGEGAGDMQASTYDPAGGAKQVAFADDLADVATTGSYDDLTDKPTIPTDTNQLTNGAGYITDYTVTEEDVTAHEAALTITESQISDLNHFSGDYTDLTNKPTIPSTPADIGAAPAVHTHTEADLTVGAGNNNQVLKIIGGVPTWSADNNTTYAEISTSEITDGTASTLRTISGRRAQEIVDKARSGLATSSDLTSGLATKVNGSTTITVSSTAPSSPSVGDLWVDMGA